ncbi:uncharacterized protein LOC135394661 [Ornithodoros turicata]|uniref:uncharacterized protein LOC135394661 n=1 Tax=Ornithodoros turicata TaxID=34597 RepID=UPI00313A4805
MNQYDQVIRQYFDNNHAVRVNPEKAVKGPVYYLLHHAMIRPEREITKVRIVFDASSSSPGFLSLNDLLHSGPNLNSDILSLLLRFRIRRAALVAVIEKAFLQIYLHGPDTDALHFLWYSSTPLVGKPLAPVETWRMTRVPSGTRSSPFLLPATFHHHLQKSEEDHPQTAALLLRSFYVDDLVISVDTTADIEMLYEETCQIFSNAGMKV